MLLRLIFIGLCLIMCVASAYRSFKPLLRAFLVFALAAIMLVEMMMFLTGLGIIGIPEKLDTSTSYVIVAVTHLKNGEDIVLLEHSSGIITSCRFGSHLDIHPSEVCKIEQGKDHGIVLRPD